MKLYADIFVNTSYKCKPARPIEKGLHRMKREEMFSITFDLTCNDAFY